MDDAHRKTDKKLEEMERHLSAIYSKKEKALSKELQKFAKNIKKESDELLENYRNAETREEKQKAKKAYILYFDRIKRTKKFKRLSEFVADEIYKTNIESSRYINGKAPEIYAMNYNAMGKELESDLPYYFQPVTEEEVEKYSQMELQTVNKKKDKDWNKKNTVSSLMAGALLMLPAERICRRISGTVSRKNYNSAKMQASGAATYSENKGRLDSMERCRDYGMNEHGKYTAASLGFDIQKRWNAVKDNRTRQSHRELDGTTIQLDEEFKPGLSQPRDPHAPNAEIDNCRCWITYISSADYEETDRMAARRGTVKGTVQDERSFRGTQTVHVPKMTYKEWMEWKKRGKR